MQKHQEYVDKITTSLPQSSLAEFRTAAWQQVDRHTVGSLVFQLYWAWCALGGVISLLIFSVAGAIIGIAKDEPWVPGVVVFTVVSLLLLALLLWRIVKKFQQAAAVRQKILSLSREIDDRVARGDVPPTPTGWTSGMLPAPHEYPTSKKGNKE